MASQTELTASQLPGAADIATAGQALLFFVMLYALWRWLNSRWSQAHPRMSIPTGSINPARMHPYPTTGAMLLYIVGLALITLVIRIWFPFGRWFPPLDQNFGEFPQYISMFILGLIAYRRGWLTQIPDAVGSMEVFKP